MTKLAYAARSAGRAWPTGTRLPTTSAGSQPRLRCRGESLQMMDRTHYSDGRSASDTTSLVRRNHYSDRAASLDTARPLSFRERLARIDSAVDPEVRISRAAKLERPSPGLEHKTKSSIYKHARASRRVAGITMHALAEALPAVSTMGMHSLASALPSLSTEHSMKHSMAHSIEHSIEHSMEHSMASPSLSAGASSGMRSLMLFAQEAL